MESSGRHTLKEIEEQPEVIQKTIENSKIFEELAGRIGEMTPELIVLTGSGSSFNAGFASSYMLNNVAKIPTWVVHSSEFPYIIEPILKKERHLLVAISQSGESPGTVAAVKEAVAKGIPTIAVTAHPENPLGQHSAMTLPLICGEEISIMATKTYMAQIAALTRLAIELGTYRKENEAPFIRDLLNSLRLIPNEIRKMSISLKEVIKNIAPYYKFAKYAFILGTGPDYATAMEAALKLKEGAQIIAEAYSAPEFRHGPIILADEYTMILGIIPHSSSKRYEAVVSLLEKVKRRHSSIIGITPHQEVPLDFSIQMPHLKEELSPLINIVPVQYLAYFIALLRGYDPDKPKYLTKVVTEE
jgi:glucosamine--fructose-6-phosphate aminotransferase (isomerizing)